MSQNNALQISLAPMMNYRNDVKQLSLFCNFPVVKAIASEPTPRYSVFGKVEKLNEVKNQKKSFEDLEKDFLKISWVKNKSGVRRKLSKPRRFRAVNR